MTAEERHARLKQIQPEIVAALKLRAGGQQRIDMLYLEKERLEDECFEEFCPCIEDDQDDDGNSSRTRGQAF
jgi:hypothetical protein